MITGWAIRIPAGNTCGGFSKVPQLYDLSTDSGEQVNLAEETRELVSGLQLQLDRIVGDTY